MIAAIDNSRNALPTAWAGPTRRWALRTIAEEGRIQKTYASLSSSTLQRATAAAGRADVRAVERVIATVVRRDAELGRKRPEEINALLEQVRVQLDAARRLRLARDQWHERASSYRAYMKSVTPILNAMTQAQRSLDASSASGSDAAVLLGLGDRLARHAKPDVVNVRRVKASHAMRIAP